MRRWHIRRLLFGLFCLQEALIWARSTEEQRRQAPPVAPQNLFIAFVSLPFFWRLNRPAWLERLGLGLQVTGWSLELVAMAQLIRKRSFGIHPTAAKTGVTSGLYRLEHPIYLGLLASHLGWTLPCPPSWPAVLIMYRALRQAIAAERRHLATLDIRHRGLDSRLWDLR